MCQSCTDVFPALVKITLFCKFCSVCRNVRFVYVCNVRRLPKLLLRPKQNLHRSSHFLYWFGISSIYGSISLFNLAGNGHVYETFGILENRPVKPLQSLLNVPPSKLALSAKCFIYFVVRSCFIFFLVFIFLNLFNHIGKQITILFNHKVIVLYFTCRTSCLKCYYLSEMRI